MKLKLIFIVSVTAIAATLFFLVKNESTLEINNATNETTHGKYQDKTQTETSSSPVIKQMKQKNNQLLQDDVDFYIDTSWQERTLEINGKQISYIFGDGNPSDIALTTEEIAKIPDIVRTLPSNYTTYMKAEAEWAMKDFLEHQGLPKLLKQCNKTLSASVQPQDLSMENILYIDKETGRKEFKKELISNIGDGFTTLRSPSNPEKWKSCLDESEIYILNELEDKFSQVINNYIIYENSVDVDKPIIREVVPEVLNSTPPPGYDTNTDSDYINNGRI